MNGLDLFSGIGGIGIVLKQFGVRTIAYCEQNEYAQGVLLSRMQSGDIDRAPIFADVRELRAENFITRPEIIFGGFPCQDISVAGNGKGLAGERSGLFYEIVRLTKEIRPHFVFLENVPAIRTRGLEQVIKAFTKIGYDCRWTMLSASSVGAPHKRERWFLLAHPNSEYIRHEQRRGCGQDRQGKNESGHYGQKRTVANSKSIGRGKRALESSRQGEQNDTMRSRWWEVEPSVGRVVDGIPYRVDRIKCLGNSVVPLQAKKAFIKLSGLKELLCLN